MRRRNFLLIAFALVICLVGLIQLHFSRSHVIIAPDVLDVSSSSHKNHHPLTTPTPPVSRRHDDDVDDQQEKEETLQPRSPSTTPSSSSPRSLDRHFILLSPSLGLDPNAPVAQRKTHIARSSVPNPAQYALHERAHFLRQLYAEHHGYSYVLDDGTAQLPIEAAVGAAGATATLSGIFSATQDRDIAPWFKISLLLKYIGALLAFPKNKNTKKKDLWLAFLDVDVMLSDLDRGLEPILNSLPRRGGTVDIVVGTAALQSAAAPLSGQRGSAVVDTSFMMVRVSSWSQKFFTHVFQLGEQYRDAGPPAACLPVPIGMHERGAMQCLIEQLRLGLSPFPNDNDGGGHNSRVFVVKSSAPSTSALSAFSTRSSLLRKFPQCRLKPAKFKSLHGGTGSESASCPAAIDRAFKSIVAKNHIHESLQSVGAVFVKLPDSFSSLLGGNTDTPQQQSVDNSNSPSPSSSSSAATVAIFSFVRRKDLRNASLRELFWGARVLREAACKRCNFDCIIMFEQPSIFGDDAILDDDAAAEQQHHHHHHAAHMAHVRQKRQQVFWEGKWKLLRDEVLPRYESVFVAPADAFFMPPPSQKKHDFCSRFSTEIFSVSHAAARAAAAAAAVDDEDDHAKKEKQTQQPVADFEGCQSVGSCFDLVMTSDWRGTVSGGIFAVRNTRWVRSLLSQTLNAAWRRYHRGESVDQQQQQQPQDGGDSSSLPVASAADVREATKILTATSLPCFYCADDADDAVARALALASVPAPPMPHHHQHGAQTPPPREHLIEIVNDANGGGDKRDARRDDEDAEKNKISNNAAAAAAAPLQVHRKSFRVFIETNHRRWNAYAFPADAKHKTFRHRMGQDPVARFPRCGLFFPQQQQQYHPSCFVEATRMYSATVDSGAVGAVPDKWAPSGIDDSTLGGSTELAAQLAPGAAAAWRNRPYFHHRPPVVAKQDDGGGEAERDNTKRRRRNRQQDAPPVRVPPAQFRKSSDVAVLVVVCASSRSGAVDNVHGEGDAVARGKEVGDVALMHRLTFETKLAYAARHGYDLIVEDCKSASEGKAVDPGWSKMLAPQRWLRHYHTVLQLDASTLVMNLAKDTATLERSFAHVASKSGAVSLGSVLMISRDASGQAGTAVMLWRNRAAAPAVAGTKKSDDSSVDQLFRILGDAASQMDCVGRSSHYDQSAIRCALNHALGKLRTGGGGGGRAAVEGASQAGIESEWQKARAKGQRASVAEKLISIAPLGTKLLFGIPRQLLLHDPGHVHGRERVNTDRHEVGRAQRRARERQPLSWRESQREEGQDIYRYRTGDFAAFVRHDCEKLLESAEKCVVLVQELLREAHSFNEPPFGFVDQASVPMLMLPMT